MNGENVDFRAPSTVDEAVGELAFEGAIAVSGGTSVGLLIGQDLIAPTRLVWLGRIPELRGIAPVEDRLDIGAAVTLRSLSAHPLVTAALPAVAAAAGAVGNTRVRAVATVGGALAHADPRQDLPPALLAHGAVVEVAGGQGRRQVPLEQLLRGFMSTTLDPDEVITKISVPLVYEQRGVYNRFTPGSAEDYPTVAVAASATRSPDASVRQATVALGGAGSTAFLVPETDRLVGRLGTPAEIAEVADAAAERAQPVDDRLGSVAYKRAMVAVWTRRCLSSCLDGRDTRLR